MVKVTMPGVPDDTPVLVDLAIEIERNIYKQALEDVVNPIQYLQRNADDQGCQLEGQMAYTLSQDVHFIKSIAKEALGV